MSLLLVGCATDHSPTYDVRQLSEVIDHSFVYPVTVYPMVNQPMIMSEIADARVLAEASKYQDAVNHFQNAIAIIQDTHGTKSTMLLPIYDELILVFLNLGEIEQADQLQHKYQSIIEKHFKGNKSVIRDTAFRMGCWHGLSGDWWQALFDFEAVIESFENSQELRLNEKRQRRHAEDLANLASKRCVPNW